MEGESAANIHRRLVNIYGKAALAISTVKRINVCSWEKGKNDLSDRLYNGRSSATLTEDEAMVVLPV